MKKFQKLGKSLNKEEQKRILGGVVAPGCDCGCTSDLDCGTMVCDKLVTSGFCGSTPCNVHQCVPK